VQDTLSATAPVPLCHTVSVSSVSVLLTSLLQHLSHSAAQSVYHLSLSCCSAEHSVCYCACPSAAVIVPSVSVLLQCRTQCLLLCLSLCCSQYTICLCPAPVQNTVSAIAPVPLLHSQCTVCLCSAAVQNMKVRKMQMSFWPYYVFHSHSWYTLLHMCPPKYVKQCN
jgi:hypothetical protein